MKSRSQAAGRQARRRAAAQPRAAGAPVTGAVRSSNNSSANTHRRSAEIIDAAAQVFAERGYHGATHPGHCRRARHPPGEPLLLPARPRRSPSRSSVRTGWTDFFKAPRRSPLARARPQEKLAGLIRAHIAPILDRGDFVQGVSHATPVPAASAAAGGWANGRAGIEKIFETVIRDGMRKRRISRRSRSPADNARDIWVWPTPLPAGTARKRPRLSGSAANLPL